MHPDRSIRLFRLFSLLSYLDFYVPVKIVYFYQVTHSYASASAIISFVWIAQALLEVPTGVFSDRIGRKNTIITGAFCAVLAYLFYAAGNIYLIFFLGSLFEGAARAFFSGNNNAYLHNLLSEQKKEGEFHHHYGKMNSLLGFAGFVGSLGSGFLLQWSVGLFMWINLLPQIGAFIVSLLLVETKQQEKVNTNIYAHLKQAIEEIKVNMNLRNLSLSEIFGGGGLAAYEYQAAVFAAVWPSWAIGIARAMQEGSVIPSFWYAGRIIDKLGYMKVLLVSWVTSVGGNVLAGFTHSVFSPIFVMMSLPLYGADDTAKQHMLQKEFTNKQRATIASLNSLGNSITFSIVLYVCGLIANHYGPFIALLATQVSLLPAAYFEYRFVRNLHKKEGIT